MTPAINEAKKRKIKFKIHQYDHDPAHESYGLEAAEKIGVPPDQVFKTLVADTGDRKLIVGILPVSTMMSMKQLAKAAGVKKVQMAEKDHVQKATGYVLGGVSPLGQKKKHATIIDSSAQNFETIFVSGGRRGIDIELSPADLASVTGASFFAITTD
jgi:Cys-tRNA(Pro)/Cys-tRNA(Cys) deacylase